MSQYRITKTLNKVYEVYVDAENKEEAERKGAELLNDGQGDLVDDYYADDTKVEEISAYKAEQRLIVTLRHYPDAADVEEAYEYAKREFAELRDRIGGFSDVEYIESGEITIEKDNKYTDFYDDEEKMRDFYHLTRDQFLASYSYLTPEEYELTLEKVRKKK